MDVSGNRASGKGPQGLLLWVQSDVERCAPMLALLTNDGYEVVSCPPSASVERLIEGLQPDLVLLHPPSEAKQLLNACEEVRARSPSLLLVLSERKEEWLVARALALGVDEYLVLPIGSRELKARIDAMLRRVSRYPEQHGRTRVGGLVLSAADLSVELNGRKVFLSPIEYRLLSCLASMPSKVFTHEALMSRVWGAEYVDSRHYLHLYVRYLREKLEHDPSNPQLILSEWGVGYRLQPP